MEDILNKFDSLVRVIAEELRKKINSVQFFQDEFDKLLLYVEAYNEYHQNNFDNARRLFNVNGKNDILILLSEYDFSSSFVCTKVTDVLQESSAHFLCYCGDADLHIVTDERLAQMLMDDMVDIVKDVLRFNANEVYQRFYTSEIFGLICEKD